MISPGSEAGITVEVAAAGLPGVEGEGAPGPALPPALPPGVHPAILVTSVLAQHQCPQLAAIPSPAMFWFNLFLCTEVCQSETYTSTYFIDIFQLYYIPS